MREWLRRWLLGDATEQVEDQIWGTIDDLNRLLGDAEATGGQFLPGARAAREMLRSIGRR